MTEELIRNLSNLTTTTAPFEGEPEEITKGITHKLDEQFVKHRVSEFSMEWNPNVELYDCAWILANAFLILTMQTGFGMLEAGNVSSKNVANIMVKNVIDVTVGGITYWIFGYALSFGRPSNAFCGFGDFFFSVDGASNMGTLYARYVFQFSFATAATTIVSGAVAERMKGFSIN